MPEQKKNQLGLVSIGHVDAGKSTLLGHLIYLLGGIDKRSVDRLEKMAAHAGRSSYKYAWMLDQLQAERERGITITPSVWRAETRNFCCTLLDVPGHRDFVKSMINGTSQADAAILVVSAARGEFEAGISPEGQTREHALLAYTLGIKQLIVACNKMDAPSVNYSEERFNEVTQNTTKYLKKIGFKECNVVFIPVSGWQADNLVEPSVNMPWFTGPSIVDAVDGLSAPERTTDKSFRLPVKDVYKVGGIGTVITGVVAAGTVNRDTLLTIAPSGGTDHSLKPVTTHVLSIESHHMQLDKATAGQHVGFQVRAPRNVIHSGSVCSDFKQDPVKVTRSFEARIVILNHPKHIREGYTPMIDCHTAHVRCRFDTIVSKIDRKTGAEVEKNPAHLVTGDAAIVRCTPVKPMVVERYSEYPALGRFAIRDINQVVGIGIVLDVTKHEEQ